MSGYQRINFKDQNVERPKTYDVTNNPDGSITLIESFGNVEELGTPINQENMNHLEDGIDAVSFSKFSLDLTYKKDDLITDIQNDELKIFKSLQDNNFGHLPSESEYWEETQLSGANIDLSNLSEEGEKHFLGKSNITNCLTKIPQNIKLELNNGTLTLKAGSILPWGSLEYQTTTVTEDKTYTYSGDYANVQCAVFCAQVGGAIQGPVRLVDISSGTGEPPKTTTFSRYYSSTTGIIYIKKDTGWVEWTVALPIAIVTINENGVISSIDQVFNGIGYIGSTVWVDKGVKGLIPNGRNEDGSLKNKEFVTSQVFISTNSGQTSAHNFAVASSGIDVVNNYSYDAEKNLVYRPNDKKIFADRIVAGQITVSSGLITSLNTKQVFHALDYNDKHIPQADGQWVSKRINNTLQTAIGTQTLDLSDYLPNDNYDYEVMVGIHIYRSGGNTDSAVYISSDILNRVFMAGARSDSLHSHNTTPFPIGAGRSISVITETTATTSAEMAFYGYRRLGKNN